MPTNVKVDDLKINKLTKAQYEAAVQGGTIGEYELSVLTDDNTYATSEQLTQGLATKQDTISDLATIRSGAAAGATAVQPAAIADMETQTHASATYATKTELANKQDIMQYSTMPTASVDNVGDIVQFVGTTDSTYTNGHFYKCVSDGQDPATYSWEEVSLGGSSLPDQTGQSGNFLTTDGSSASWETVNALQNGSTGTGGLCIEGNGGSYNYTVYIGYNTSAKTGSVVVGADSNAGGQYAVALGYHAWGQGDYSIQIGYGENWTANTMSVGLSDSNNYRLLDSDGTIPEARLASTTSATQGQVLTLDTNLNAVWETPSGGSSLPDMTGHSGEFLTTNGSAASWGTINALKNSASNTTSISIRQTNGTQAVGSNCVTIGDTTTYTDNESVAIGYKAKIGNSYATSIGTESTAWSPETVAIGYKANAWGYYGVSVGSETHAEGSCVALGYKSEALASNIAIGSGLYNGGRGSICIGHWTGATPQVTNTEYGCFKVYLAQDSTGNTVAEYKILDPDGTIPEARLADTTSTQEGDALTLNSSGNAVWTNPLQYVLGGLQTTDSSKVGYLQYYFEENNAVNAPAGGKWLVLDCLKVNTGNGLTYVFSADFTSPVGSIVAGGTQIAAARSGYTTRALLLKVA